MKAKLTDLEMGFNQVGVGRPFILLHGFGLNRHIWDPVVGHYKSKACFITPDLRGHGKTQVPPGVYSMHQMANDIAGLIDTLGLEKIILGGHSMGGYIVLAFAQYHRDRLAGLALITTNARPDDPLKREGRLALVDAVKEMGAAALADNLAPRLSKDKVIVEAMHAMILHTDPAGIIGAALGMAERPDMLEVLRQVNCPVLVVAGQDDMITPMAASEEMAHAAPRGELLVIPNCGHMPMLEVPDILGESLIAL